MKIGVSLDISHFLLSSNLSFETGSWLLVQNGELKSEKSCLNFDARDDYARRFSSDQCFAAPNIPWIFIKRGEDPNEECSAELEK